MAYKIHQIVVNDSEKETEWDNKEMRLDDAVEAIELAAPEWTSMVIILVRERLDD